ncbi:MAG: GTPase [Candidatus Zambryskibacteria bacterium]|nr:GTPase [Candidatus Zambryskibacteria bacterium]QQG46384.1 MAG: GTPase [Candidatus Niyogibacteria bacterium]
MKKRRILILGAAGRDFHNFNTVYKNNGSFEVVAFTASQIPGIAGRKYPASLSGKLYPSGIPIEDENNLENIIKEKDIDECVLSYSDLSYTYVMRLASRVLSSGATFSMLGAAQTMLESRKPVVAVTAVRTGCGKSQTTRRIVEILREAGKKVAVVRHPMPYSDLASQAVQRFSEIKDLEKHHCTIEEMEEYEPHLARGSVVFAGVDYGAVLEAAEKEADIIVWDGGNNDTPFFRPDFSVVVADPFRAGHEIGYYPGEINFRMSNVILINKVDPSNEEGTARIEENAKKYNPSARVIKSESIVTVDNPEIIRGKAVLVIEDGPTVTHGDMKFGAGMVVAKKYQASRIVDPRPYALGGIREAFAKYPHLECVLPALGYGEKQIKELEETLNKAESDAVIVATPIDLGRFIKIKQPSTRVRYELPERIKDELRAALKERKII